MLLHLRQQVRRLVMANQVRQEITATIPAQQVTREIPKVPLRQMHCTVRPDMATEEPVAPGIKS